MIFTFCRLGRNARCILKLLFFNEKSYFATETLYLESVRSISLSRISYLVSQQYPGMDPEDPWSLQNASLPLCGVQVKGKGNVQPAVLFPLMRMASCAQRGGTVRRLSSYNLLFSYFVYREHLLESEVCTANQALGRGLWERRGGKGRTRSLGPG